MKKRSDRVRLGTLVVLSIALIIAVMTGIAERQARNKAETARDEALDRARRTEALRLVAESRMARTSNPGLSLLLALESAKLHYEAGAATEFRVLEALHHCRELRTLIGHRGSVYTATFSPDGQEIVTASADRTARIWDPQTGKTLQVLEGHDGPVREASYSRDGGQILTYSLDGTARLFDSTSGAPLFIFKHEKAVTAARFSPRSDRVITCSADGKLSVWNSYDGTLVQHLRSGGSPLVDAWFSPDGETVAVLTIDHSLLLIDATEGTNLKKLRCKPAPGRKLLFSANGRYVAAPGILYDIERDVILTPQMGTFIPAAFSPSGKSVVTLNSAPHPKTGEDLLSILPPSPVQGASCQLIDLPSLHTSTKVHKEGSSVRAVSFNAQGDFFASCNAESASVHDAITGKKLLTLRGHDLPLHSVSFNPGGSLIVTTSEDLTVRIWSASPHPGLPASLDAQKLQSISLSQSKNYVLAVTLDGSADVYARKKGELAPNFPRPTFAVRKAEFLGKTDTVAVLGESILQLIDPQTGHLRTIETPDAPLAFAANHRGDQVLVSCGDGKISLHDATDGSMIHSLVLESPPDEEESKIYSLALSPDASRFTTAGSRGALCFDTLTGNELITLIDLVTFDAEFDPSGNRILLAGKGWAVLADARTGEVLTDLNGGICSARLAPDGKKVLTLPLRRIHEEIVELRGNPSVFDATTGQLLSRCQGHAVTAEYGTFDPTGEMALTLSRDPLDPFHSSELRVWPVHPLPFARRQKPRTLTPRELERFQIGTADERETRRKEWLGNHFTKK